MTPRSTTSLVAGVLASAFTMAQLFAQAESPSPPISQPAPSMPTKETADSGPTDLMLQDQFQSLSRRVEQMQKTLDDVREYADRIAKAKDSLNQRAFPANSKAVVEALQAALNSLKALPGNAVLTKPESGATVGTDTPVGNYLKTYINVQFGVTQSFDDVIVAAFPRLPSWGDRAESATDRLINSLSKTGADPRSTNWTQSLLPASDDLYARLRQLPSATTAAGAPPVNKQSLDTQINAAQVELSGSATDIQNKLFNAFRDLLRGELEKIQAAVDAEIKKEQQAIDSVRRDRQDIANQIQARAEKKEKQTVSVTGQMIYAVIMMICAIVLSFLALWIYKEPLSLAVVRERTFVDLLSMGFLLVTVIVLGTGGFLDRQAIGTLLGTIAGYIFTRRLGTSEARSSQAEPITLPGAPTAVSYDAKRHRVSAKRPAGANGLVAYAKASTGNPLVVGSSTTDSVVIDTSLLSPGKYDAWVVGTNAKGEGPASDHFSIDIPASA